MDVPGVLDFDEAVPLFVAVARAAADVLNDRLTAPAVPRTTALRRLRRTASTRTCCDAYYGGRHDCIDGI